MTRFARSKGSKASNERLPETATSWSEMKQQLLEKNKEIEESKKRQVVIDQRNASYKAFLKEKEESESKETKWADFPGVTKPVKLNKKVKKIPVLSLNGLINKKPSKSNKTLNSNHQTKNVDENLHIQVVNEESDRDAHPENENAEQEIVPPPKTNKVKQKKKLLKITEDSSTQNNVTDNVKNKRKLGGNDESKKKKLKISNSTCENEINDKLKEEPQKIIKQNLTEEDSDAPPEEESAKQELAPPPKIKKVKQKKKLLKIIVDRKNNTEKSNDVTDDTPKNKGKLDGNKKKKLKKSNSENTNESETNNKLKKEKPQKKIIKENLTEKDLKKIEKKKQKRIRQLEKKKRVKAELKQQKEEMEKEQTLQENGNENDAADISEKNGFSNKSEENKMDKKPLNKPFQKSFDKQGKFNTKNKDRPKGHEQNPRRKPQLPNVMFVNGKEIQIDYVDGFPVRKEDAERLKKLRREMISKGLPRSEINSALKLERRRAEKAFAREKKKVCFHCRKSGHNLSECPDLGKEEMVQTAGSGICFKCGSTEHTHFECKVVRSADYKFAQCFICKEQGHIARQCPDNARGLYPKGGACRECGDVTHLKQDCPKFQAKQQRLEDGLKIETFGASNPDVLEDKNDGLEKLEIKKRQNKIVKF